jgi:hypothetical protein
MFCNVFVLKKENKREMKKVFSNKATVAYIFLQAPLELQGSRIPASRLDKSGHYPHTGSSKVGFW